MSGCIPARGSNNGAMALTHSGLSMSLNSVQCLRHCGHQLLFSTETVNQLLCSKSHWGVAKCVWCSECAYLPCLLKEGSAPLERGLSFRLSEA